MLDFVGNGEYFELYSLNHSKSIKMHYFSMVKCLKSRMKTSNHALYETKHGYTSRNDCTRKYLILLIYKKVSNIVYTIQKM